MINPYLFAVIVLTLGIAVCAYWRSRLGNEDWEESAVRDVLAVVMIAFASFLMITLTSWNSEVWEERHGKDKPKVEVKA